MEFKHSVFRIFNPFDLQHALIFIFLSLHANAQLEIRHHQHAKGGRFHGTYATQQLCTAACSIQGNDCAAVDYVQDKQQCWMHSRRTACRSLHHMINVVHIRLLPCESGTTALRPSIRNSGSPNLENIQGKWNQQHAQGGVPVGIMAVAACLQHCRNKITCIAVDYNDIDNSCWEHGLRTACRPLRFNAHTTHYRVEDCTSMPRIPEPAVIREPVLLERTPIQHQPSFSLSTSGQKCGRPFSTPIGARIVGGTEAVPHSYPWQVGLLHRSEGVVRCGGALVGNQWVLTTSHCVDEDSNPSSWQVILGSHDLKSRESSRIISSAVKIIYHGSFDLKTFDNDVALVKLDRYITYTDSIQPVCLPEQGETLSPGTVCTVTGWGNPGGTKRALHQANLPIIKQSTCRSKAWLGGQFQITERMMCAGYETGGIDSCQGDSGGPLVCFHRDHWTQHGITSFGRGCGLPKKPGVYTRLSHFVDWIERNMRNN